MLNLFAKYAHERGIEVEPGFKPKFVRWALDFDASGVFLGAAELGEAGAKRNQGRLFDKCPELNLTEMKAGGIIKSHFLVETAEVVALAGKKSEDSKVLAKHEYFIRLLKETAQTTGSSEFVAGALEDPDTLTTIRERLKALGVKATEKVTVRIGGRFPLDAPTWHEWWRQFRRSLSAKDAGEVQAGVGTTVPVRCLVTGELVEPVRVNSKIEGLADVGGLPTGDVLIGFKQDSFCSYGFSQSANAAVSETAMAAYRAGLNHLIRNSSHKLAGVRVVHWFKRSVPAEDDPLPWLVEGEQEQQLHAHQRARELLSSIDRGERADLAGNEYYALTVSGASGRIMVRDWMEGHFEDLVRNIALWFEDLSIVHRAGGRLAREPKFLAVAASGVRDLKNLTSAGLAKLWRAAVYGSPLPESAMALALARVRIDVLTDEGFNHARMGILRAFLVRKERKETGMTHIEPYLNANHPSPAYHCGRLMAVLAGLQRAALGDVGAGVVQRYYAAASSTPALIFGRLIRTGQFHLNKLDAGLAYWFENSISEISCKVGDRMPATLTLEQQSLFALGYYQQLADMRTKKVDTSKNGENDEQGN